MVFVKKFSEIPIMSNSKEQCYFNMLNLNSWLIILQYTTFHFTFLIICVSQYVCVYLELAAKDNFYIL